MAHYEYFKVPRNNSLQALQFYKIAKDDAISAWRDLLNKYSADFFLKSDSGMSGFGWKEKPIALTGFTIPRWNSDLRLWIQAPKKNTIRGKQAALEMSDLVGQIELWEQVIGRTLGVEVGIYSICEGSMVFMNTVCWPTNDGAILLGIPVRDTTERILDEHSRPDPVAPSYALPIAKEVASSLVKNELP